jgi:hypothetical protein
MDAFCPCCHAPCSSEAPECGRCKASFAVGATWRPLAVLPELDPIRDDLKGLKYAGFAFLLVPVSIYILGLVFGGGGTAILFFFLSIPVGVLGLGFLLVWAPKALRRRLRK